MKVRIEKIEKIKAKRFHSSSDKPEEDALKKLISWAKPLGLYNEESEFRVFGRNTYPTDKPEPHGYEIYFAPPNVSFFQEEKDVKEIPKGKYAVLRYKNLNRMGEAWKYLWGWLENSEYEHFGWEKGEFGWVNGYEEILNPFEKNPEKWLFDLWIRLKE